MKLIDIRATGLRLPPRAADKTRVEAAPDRALAVVHAAARADANAYPAQQPAVFLAHLIAMKTGCPQTRERRRGEPDQAVRAYEAAMSAKTYDAGRNLSRAS